MFNAQGFLQRFWKPWDNGRSKFLLDWMLDNAIIQNMKFKLARSTLQSISAPINNYHNNNNSDAGTLLYTSCPQNLPLFPHTLAKFSEPGLLNPLLVSVVRTCCVAYTDQIHLCGREDAILGSVCSVFPPTSFLLTLFVLASFSVDGIYLSLLSGAWLQNRLYLLLFKNLHSPS